MSWSATRDLRPPPDVPVVVILAAKPYPPLPGLPFDSERHFRADLSHRIEVLQDWALASERGTLVVTNHASHAVPRDDPDLIVWAVQRADGCGRQMRREGHLRENMLVRSAWRDTVLFAVLDHEWTQNQRRSLCEV